MVINLYTFDSYCHSLFTNKQYLLISRWTAIDTMTSLYLECHGLHKLQSTPNKDIPYTYK